MSFLYSLIFCLPNPDFPELSNERRSFGGRRHVEGLQFESGGYFASNYCQALKLYHREKEKLRNKVPPLEDIVDCIPVPNLKNDFVCVLENACLDGLGNFYLTKPTPLKVYAEKTFNSMLYKEFTGPMPQWTKDISNYINETTFLHIRARHHEIYYWHIITDDLWGIFSTFRALALKRIVNWNSFVQSPTDHLMIYPTLDPHFEFPGVEEFRFLFLDHFAFHPLINEVFPSSAPPLFRKDLGVPIGTCFKRLIVGSSWPKWRPDKWVVSNEHSPEIAREFSAWIRNKVLCGISKCDVLHHTGVVLKAQLDRVYNRTQYVASGTIGYDGVFDCRSCGPLKKDKKIVWSKRNSVRTVLNGDEMEEFLRTKSQRVVAVDFGDIDFKTAIHLLADCDIFIGLWGSSLTNFFFLPPGSVIIQLNTNGLTADEINDWVPPMWKDHKLITVSNSAKSNNFIPYDRLETYGDAFTKSEEQLAIFENNHPPTFQLSYVYWRDRDTIINITALDHAINEAFEYLDSRKSPIVQ